MRVRLVVNPRASTVSEARLRAVEERLGRIGTVETRRTERPMHARTLAAEADCDLLVAYGGDGHANEVLNGLPDGLPVAFLPGGGTSVLARALGFPRDAVRAAGLLEVAARRTISLGRVNGRRFAFSAGLGVDADTVRAVDRLGRSPDGRRPGDLAFARAAAAAIWRGYPQDLEVHGHGRVAAVFACNDAVYSYAGSRPIVVSPRARFELGLDLAGVRRVDRARAWPILGRLALGLGVGGANGILLHDQDRIEITCARPVAAHADGEDLGDLREIVLEAERAAATVLVPAVSVRHGRR